MKPRKNRPSCSRLVLLLAATFAISLVTGSVAPGAQERRNLRRFAPQDLGVLEGPDREAWQRPEQIMDALGIADGAAVADLGAGGGWFTVRLARRVGPRGLVYAEDIQREMIESMERRVQREGLRNVRMVLGTPDDPKLRPQSVDAVLFVDSYHEVERPIDLLRNVRSALKPNGRLGIVEFRKDGWGPGPPLDERVDENVVIKDAAAAGLQFVSRETFLPYQYLLIFGKA